MPVPIIAAAAAALSAAAASHVGRKLIEVGAMEAIKKGREGIRKVHEDHQKGHHKSRKHTFCDYC